MTFFVAVWTFGHKLSFFDVAAFSRLPRLEMISLFEGLSSEFSSTTVDHFDH
jgi:hypothetical protein